MKTPTPFKSLLLFVLLVAAGGFGQQAKAQEDTCAVNVIHTYMNGRFIPWDSVEVKVARNVGDSYYLDHSFMMYWPDTILSNCTTWVDEYVQDKEWGLSQNYPNPCMGESRVKLTTRTPGTVKLQVMGLQGRLCCQRTEMLPAGEHQLLLTLPHSGVYFVQAETNEGRKVSKVLCAEGSGSGFDIRVSSSSYQIEEKTERGGEGLFNMTDRMIITAYITYNDEVRSNGWTVNYTSELDGEVISEWLYNQGSVNIHFSNVEDCDTFSLSGRTFYVIATTHMCLPTVDYPISYRVTFGDTTLYSEPTEYAPYSSSTWQFNGMYKYRYYPEDLGGCICIGDINGEMPPEHIDYYGQVSPTDYWFRLFGRLSCDEFRIEKFSVYGSGDIEFVVSEE